ncbi:MAG: hypothetical protein KF846_03570 [Cyclobacteriaceae bacterium]|nr:hypothetical protein [Cyclobacteriaceae bacterium]MBX2955209.1 hypothetical protein [Cyclobacteriaceae bacterium]
MKNVVLISVALLILVLVFVFQRFNYALALNSLVPFQIENPNTIFVINKTIRLVLNDTACMMLIFVWFKQRQYLTLAFFIFLIELFILLPVYFIIKLSLEGDSEISSPLLSQVHRLIVNPLLMFLLMAGFVYQRIRTKN